MKALLELKTIPVLFENDDFVIIAKPIDVSIQDELDISNSKILVPGLVSRLKIQLNLDSLHPVHRLDKVTSGLLIVAKHSLANQELSIMFAKKQVKKIYLAITRTRQGDKPKKKQGSIVGDMGPARNGDWKLLRTKSNPSKTRFYSLSLGDRYRLCLVEPLTGKTHQIRVAMKSLSMPIVGDARYGGDPADRTYLHAHRLMFSFQGEDFSFVSLPDVGEFFRKHINNELVNDLYLKAKSFLSA